MLEDNHRGGKFVVLHLDIIPVANNALLAACATVNAQIINKKKKKRKERRGEGNARAFESVDLAGIEFIGNYFFSTYPARLSSSEMR